jgi:putative ABC transport system permease protein
MRQSLPPVAAGIVCGLAGAVLLARFVQTLLFGTSAFDPALFGGASLSLAVVATVAAAIPARRASRTSPIEAIRGS